MSQFIPQHKVANERVAQTFRRIHIEKTHKDTLEAAKVLFDKQTTEELGKAIPTEMQEYLLLTDAGLTSKHVHNILGRWYQERLAADKAEAAKKAREEREQAKSEEEPLQIQSIAGDGE